MADYLGIEIGGTKLQLVAGEGREIRQRWRFAVDKSAGGEGIRAQIAQALPEILRDHRPAAVGVGFGGPVDFRTGQICCSHQIEGWSDFQLGAWLRERTGLLVRVDNDANVASLGEAVHGAGMGFNPVFYVTLGSGVGGGLSTGGRIYHGAKPGEAEIGHVRLDRRGAIVESRCSGWAVDKRVRGIIRKHPKALLAKLAGGKRGGEARCLGEALAAGDRAAQRILRETAEDLAFGLSHVVHLIHPEVIVVGGGLSLLGEPLRAAVARALPGFIMEAFHPGPEIRLAGLAEDAVPVGALTLAASRD